MKISQAILPVAGLGTRFLPWTKAIPKEMLPLSNRPIIAYVVDECLEAGITDICFVISHGKEAILRYFEEDPALAKEMKRRGKEKLLTVLKTYEKAHFETAYQEQMLGDGHAILQAGTFVKSDMVAVLFGDDLFVGDKPGIVQLIEASHFIPEKEFALIAVENIPREKTNRYGIIEIENEVHGHPRLRKVKGLVEKPEPVKAPSTLGIVGRYLIPRSVIASLPDVQAGKDGEIRLIDALIAKLKTLPVYALECSGSRIDTGTPEGYAEAVRLLGMMS
ncbi:MAG: sugar phosphate nucleotidyltransferase [Candidatus Peribacteraceae bacterium]|nr:sugar phosphate nucleotidyltransferase [Candidatus Peribacteraceae bacterium]MDD5742520.1 sugar phosphate nucleotidyltransferase [Candidatus Peribacteraceae bacterium]